MKKKIKPFLIGREFYQLGKILRIMKLTTLFLLATTMLVSASVYSQSTRLTLKFSDISFEALFQEIEKKSEFRFAFSNSKLNPNAKIQINTADETLEKILDKALPPEVGYEIIDRYVVILDASEKNSLTESASIQQQQTALTGKVTDSNRQPLPGVTVVIKGTSRGTITDTDGNYVLSNIPPDATLVFSFVGMHTQEIAVSDRTQINAQMEEESIGLDEVVAVGYGTVKKQDLTGSVTKIKSESLEERAITTLGEAFAGQLAGVRARESNSEPGSELSITIRGVNTITASSSPLYVIDGVPVNSIKDFNPSDIESIEVMKDASSSAIYGARGANGVILITTKRGEKEAPVFNFNANYGLQKIDDTYPLMNRDEWLAHIIVSRNIAYIRAGGSMDDPNEAREARLQIPDAWVNNPESLPNTNWQEELYRIAPIQRYNLSVSGGGNMGTYLISAGYLDQEGIMIGSAYKRMNFRANTRLDIGDNIEVGLNIAPSFSSRDIADGDNAAHTANYFAPVTPIDMATKETGWPPGVTTHINPIKTIEETFNINKYNSIYSTVWGKWDITKSFTFKSQYGHSYIASRNEFFRPTNVQDGGAPSVGNANTSESYDYSWQNTINYMPEISSQLDINFLVGQTVEEFNSFNLSGSATDYPNDLVHTLNVAATKTNASTGQAETALLSYFGRVMLSYYDKYLITANIRRDGSSKFGNDTKWGWFPSVSVGWKIDREKFMENVEWLDLLKIRVLYGEAGNNSVGNYSHIPLL